jgi:hypothetical protein
MSDWWNVFAWFGKRSAPIVKEVAEVASFIPVPGVQVAATAVEALSDIVETESQKGLDAESGKVPSK